MDLQRQLYQMIGGPYQFMFCIGATNRWEMPNADVSSASPTLVCANPTKDIVTTAEAPNYLVGDDGCGLAKQGGGIEPLWFDTTRY